MFNFSALKDKLTGGANKLAGRTDLLEAACAASALVAAADGDIDADEIVAALDAVQANETLSQSFPSSEIEAVMDRMLKKANGSFTGKAALMKEIKEVPASDGEPVFLVALDVANADGDISPEEIAVLKKIGKELGQNPATYLS